MDFMKVYGVHPAGDVAAVGSIVLTLLDYAPKVAAVFAIAWYTYLLSKVAGAFLQRLLKRLRG